MKHNVNYSGYFDALSRMRKYNSPGTAHRERQSLHESEYWDKAARHKRHGEFHANRADSIRHMLELSDTTDTDKTLGWMKNALNDDNAANLHKMAHYAMRSGSRHAANLSEKAERASRIAGGYPRV